MTSPLAAGLFKRVISESGPAFDAGQTLAQAESFGSAVGALAPGNAQSSALQRLRALSAADVAALVARAKDLSSIAATTVDGWVLPMSSQQAFLGGSLQKADLLIGLNGRELSAFRVAAAAAAKSAASSGNGTPDAALKKALDAARPYYGNWMTPAMAVHFDRILLNKNAGLDGAANDLLAACPIGAVASLTHAAGTNVFVHRFDRSIPGKGAAELGAFHGVEVPYVFGTLRSPEWQWLPSTADDVVLSDLMQTYWTNFARTGNPNAAGLPDWPAWSDQDKKFLLVNVDGSVTTQHNFPPLFSSLDADELKRRFKAD